MKNRIFAILLCIALMISLCSCTYSYSYNNEFTPNAAPPENTALSVHFIDVGQGDSILLQSDDDFVLIDAGEVEYGPVVCEYLKSVGVDTIDYVIATHPHSDHIGGLSDVINQFDCENFITKESDQQTKTWMNVLTAVEKNDVNYIEANVSDTYSFSQASFEILAPNSDHYDGYNDYSVVVKVTCGDTSFLFTGDAEKLSEKEMINSGADLSADVLKVAHHGSTTSSSDAFLDAVNPQFAVISCGENNDYGHPHKEVISEFSKRGVTVYRTDELSTIIAYSDKKVITFTYTNSDKTVVTPTVYDAEKYGYIGNKNSKKYHRVDCSGAKDISEKNKMIFSTKEEAVNNGYVGCKTCNP